MSVHSGQSYSNSNDQPQGRWMWMPNWLASQERSGQPPGGTESNAIIQTATMQFFPELLDNLNSKHHPKADANGSKQMNTNHLEADADGYLQSMTMTR